jgi:GNAT superfamily N-acetyltransferase
MSWHLQTGHDATSQETVRTRLIEFNVTASAAVRQRFEPQHLKTRPVEAYAVDDAGEVLGGCVGSTEDVWHWLTIDLMWVSPDHRGTRLGRRLLEEVEDQARERGCRWAKLHTWDFQAPEFYARCGYEIYGREIDYPPGHVNHLMRKDL